MGGGGRGGGWNGLRSFRQDRSVLEHRVKKGTTRRILHFAVPYRRILSIYPLPVVDPRRHGGGREPAASCGPSSTRASPSTRPHLVIELAVAGPPSSRSWQRRALPLHSAVSRP